jgi:uncharacterized membrane protein YagU involved in acid resistance
MNTRASTLTPLGAVARGVVAGVVGTAAMTAWQELSARLMSSGDEQDSGGEETEPQDPWEQASAPAKVAKRIGEGVFHKEVSADRIPLLTNATHWGYGTGWGVVYGLVAGSKSGGGSVRRGVLFGTAVWVMSYVELVPMGLYEPPWKYPPKSMAMELSYHVVYGVGAAAGFSAARRA